MTLLFYQLPELLAKSLRCTEEKNLQRETYYLECALIQYVILKLET